MSDINKQLEDWNWSKGGSIGIVKSSKDLELLKELIAQVQQEAYKAGQKSREKEIVEILQSVETIAEDEQKHHFTEHCPCLRYAIYKVENPDTEEMAYASSIKSLSLTKESK